MTGLVPRTLARVQAEDASTRSPSPLPTHISMESSSSQVKVLNDSTPGYVSEPFAGKINQMEAVMDDLDSKGFIPETLIENETKWFYNNLGIDDAYFATESVSSISSQIMSLYGAKVAAFARGDKNLEIRLDREDDRHAIYIDTSTPGVNNLNGTLYEPRIDSKYLDISNSHRAYRLETFRSPGTITPIGTPNGQPQPASKQQLRCYFVYKCDFFKPDADENETDLAVISDKAFYAKASENTKTLYKNIIEKAIHRTGPVIDHFEIQGSSERRVIIAFRQGTASGYFSALSHLYHYYGLTSSRKYVEQFSNGITIVTLYLTPATLSNSYPPIEDSIHQVIKEASLLFCLPNSVFHDSFAKGELSIQESVYAHCAAIFIQHFVNRLGSEYASLAKLLDPSKTVHMEVLSKIKRRLRQETFTREYIIDILSTHLDAIRSFYLQFANTHYVQSYGETKSLLPTLSYQRLKTTRVPTDGELKAIVNAVSSNEHVALVLNSLFVFNKHILKTNFYTPTKVALSFRFDPSFLPESEYPDPLYGMFLVIGQEFTGFHLRFRDIARGGIRIVKSRNPEIYNINNRSMFDENYNLANTQQRKNKDIPEGGSKGVVLLHPDCQKKTVIAFQKYIDSIIDLLIPASSPGIKEPIVDLYKKPEILFMGPDENTAELVDWATLHARERGATWWKSFFTGKSASLGGIPHDKYGMTSLSVRAYVEGIYRKLNVDQKAVTKMQTGGPDGDLGSNEILLSEEKYCSIVDGSGVLHDPNGLDRAELKRLATSRLMISNFDVSKLSKDGYRVLVDDKNVTLPTGELVPDGTRFRNLFHLRGNVDLFVPCGGRPEAIDINNVQELFDQNDVPKVKWIVEGANLFITQQAKVRLERAGVVLFKDASTNKGGVTSSSLEVLASLALNDEEFLKDMCVSADGATPEFYKEYVKDVQRIVVNNARMEFECLWKEHQRTGVPRSVLSDRLSYAINNLNEELQQSNLWQDTQFRNAVLAEALPRLLLNEVGLPKILERVPESYMMAIFGSHLAASFVYEKGIEPGQFAFFDFMTATRARLLQ
ncbi:hypothetical protein CANCADRAFT_80654 [Tortispora caseinolytica NRRL Y-17796]|uniref:NAD-specific glutamate dehydrogenase n=1 Tax=Tortispora caseinolytica NRRL Y-17796 TaxID=767744 RepID=A0A1E4TJM2_9ASCO|nr:hypothetical protein CANCADRAFT_80654 [Tortispora caseinolytica NRRL Y-17796]